MQNPKIIALFAGIGFVLSLLIGMFSSVKLSPLFLRAFISALFSGGLTWLLIFVFDKVFNNLQDLENASSEEGEAPILGAHVNISLGDDSLEDADNAPHFFVNQNTVETQEVDKENSGQIAKPEETQKPKLVQKEAVLSETKEVPASNKNKFETQEFEPRSLVDDKNTVSKEEISIKDEDDTSSLIEELDDLPSISVISREMGGETEEAKSIGTGTMQVQHIEAEPEQDASLIAQAIKTVLTKDS